VQLGHSGPKGSTQLGWEGVDLPLESGNWPLLAASALAYGEQNQTARRHDTRRHGPHPWPFVASTVARRRGRL
jgi:anthraniloyl-CoA monooxygenase